MTQRDEVYDEMVRRAEERSQLLNDPCKHLTRCADAACNYRMADVGQSTVAIGQQLSREVQPILGQAGRFLTEALSSAGKSADHDNG